ncbi:hypothetical protein Tco_0738008 [Tanacetum coccineum]
MSSNTPDYIYPIIVPSDSNIKDYFSSTTTLDYTLASLDYSSASPGNTSPDPLDDLSKYLLALLAISPFYDDPYMKVMQAYNATSNELPIPRASVAPPTVLPPSPMLPLSPMFDPQDLFLLEEIFPPQKRARSLSSSSTDFSTPPQVFEIRESSYKTHLERHEEQIETIIERIEHMEDKTEGLGNGQDFYFRDTHRGYPDSTLIRYEESSGQDPYHQEELYIHKEEMAPMALSDSKVNNDKSCSKTCLTNYEALKKQYDDLLVKLDDTGFKAATYKRGLATLEELTLCGDAFGLSWWFRS